MKEKGREAGPLRAAYCVRGPHGGRGENMKCSRTKNGLAVVGEALSGLVSLPGPKIDGWMSLQDRSNHEKYTTTIVCLPLGLPFNCSGTFLGLWPLLSCLRVMSGAG